MKHFKASLYKSSWHANNNLLLINIVEVNKSAFFLVPCIRSSTGKIGKFGVGYRRKSIYIYADSVQFSSVA